MTSSQKSLPAFPGAEGFGSTTVGGRGGKVIEVTNLHDSGIGSLRAAVEAKGSRIVIFKVGGTIELDSTLKIANPYITIAGQTAPGGGITLKNSLKNTKPTIKITTHDVVVRYIRARPGSNPYESGRDGVLDALTIASGSRQVYNVIVDHSSFSWATDEVVSVFYDAYDITVQWSIISEALDCSTHVENDQRQCHSMGLFLASDGQRNISIHHNLLAHNRHRNPEIKNTGIVDVVNNIVYNSGFGENFFAPTQVRGDYGIPQVNYIGNYFKPGVNTDSGEWFIDTKYEPVEIYIEGNLVPQKVMHPDSLKWVVQNPHPTPTISVTNAQQAYEQILKHAGASLGLNQDQTFFIRRDKVDLRIVEDVKNGTGKIIDDPSEVGGWPELASGTPYRDADHDGMSNKFERRYGFKVKDPSDASQDADGDGYTNLEEFLNGTCPKKNLQHFLIFRVCD
ncbi:MAG: polysaccharide lyase family 1 protein [Pleurocapsa sp.]